jgi:hypothetical protein
MCVEAAGPAGKRPSAATIMLHNLAFLVVLFGLAVKPAWTQSVDFSSFRDSLGNIGDAGVLRQLEAQRRPARNATPDQHVTHGLIALRLYAVTHDPAASKMATRSFEAAVGRNPAMGWGHFGLGLSLARSPETVPLNEGGSRGRFVFDDVARRLIGADARSRARRAFNDALHTEPPVGLAARELAALALEAQKEDWLKEARSALSALDSSGQAQTDDRVALSSVHAALGDLDTAIEEADRALAAKDPTGSALIAAGIARLRSAGREEEGSRFYFAGVRAALADELERFFDDIRPIASALERTRWDDGSRAERRALLLAFWDVRAALGGVTVSERLAEHYRRLPHVEQHYRRFAYFGAPEQNELRWLPAQKRSRFDDRGEIYLRHGPPDQVINTTSPNENPSESWLYRMPDGSWEMFHFIQSRGGYSLPYIVPCGADFVRDRVQHDARLALTALRGCDAASAALYSASVREKYYDALASDTHYPSYARELPFFYDLYTFRGQPGKTAVVAAFAVPADKLEKNVDDEGVHYRFDVSLILADTAMGTVSRTDDSATVRATRALSDQELLRAHLEVQVPPSASTLQRVIMTDPTVPGIGQLYGGPFPIPDYSGSNLMLSDIALGQPNPATGWKRGDVTLALVPTNQFPTGSFSLYYEIYNLPAGRSYTTEVMIERVDKGAGERLRGLFGAGDDVRVKYSGESSARADGTLPELRTIGVPLRKGRYRMTVIVKDDASGQTARRSRLFRIPD